ncbi:hypothetical protein KKA13_00530 [Patescibacteria group bacterium]|nr:hypothetical protein [Patescibacteria group bacterium]
MTQVTGIEAGSAISITERWEIVADSVVEIFPQPCILRLEEDDWCGSLLVRFRARHTVHQGKEGALTISPEIRSPQILKLRFQNGTSWNL